MLGVGSLIGTIRSNVRGTLCCLGGFLLMLCFASDYSYPNLNTYVVSYMRQTGKNDGLTYADFVFLTTAKAFTQGASMPFVGVLSRKLGVRLSLIIGSAIYGGGWALTYFTLESVFPLVVLSVGFCHGLGFTFVYATCLGTAQKWFKPNIKGLIGSIVVSGYGFGSFLWIPIETKYVNPNNLNATRDPITNDNYYTDPDLLSRVPSSFLVVGGIYLAMCAIGVALVQDPTQEQLQAVQEQGEDVQRKGEDVQEQGEDVQQQTVNVPRQELAENENSTDKDVFNMKPLQVLKTSVFYKIWVGFFAISLTQGLLVNFQKNFGLNLVSSDNYHATVGIFTNLSNGACRIGWGLLYDRIGYRYSMILIGTCATLVTAALPLLTYLEKDSMTVKVCFALLMTVMYTSFPGIYPVMAAGVSDAFGPEHYRANFGLLFSQSATYCLLLLLVVQVPAIFDFMDYFGLFLLAAGIGVAGVVVSAISPVHLTSSQYRDTFGTKSQEMPTDS